MMLLVSKLTAMAALRPTMPLSMPGDGVFPPVFARSLTSQQGFQLAGDVHQKAAIVSDLAEIYATGKHKSTQSCSNRMQLCWVGEKKEGHGPACPGACLHTEDAVLLHIGRCCAAVSQKVGGKGLLQVPEAVRTCTSKFCLTLASALPLCWQHLQISC